MCLEPAIADNSTVPYSLLFIIVIFLPLHYWRMWKPVRVRENGRHRCSFRVQRHDEIRYFVMILLCDIPNI